jgi:3-oxoadipate enol-lactonase
MSGGGRDGRDGLSDGDGGRPWLPPGRDVWLPGRGRTFVRELAGPPGAPVLVLLHGWTATADLNWFACFRPLAEHYRVVALDHRGHGRGLRADEPFRLEQCADDVAALARQLGIERFVPVGYSMGGPIAQLVWQRHRHLVDGLVLCATSATFTGTVRERLLFGLAAGTGAMANAVPIGRATGVALTRWNDWRHRRGCPWWGFDEVTRHDWTRIVEAGRAIGRFDSRHWVGGIDVPSAVVVTDDDDVVPTRRQWALAHLLPTASVWTVPGGHTVCTSSPQRFVPALLAACAAVTRPAVRTSTVAA